MTIFIFQHDNSYLGPRAGTVLMARGLWVSFLPILSSLFALLKDMIGNLLYSILSRANIICAWKRAINRLETCQFLIHDVSWHGYLLIRYLIIGLTLKQMAGSSNGFVGLSFFALNWKSHTRCYPGTKIINVFLIPCKYQHIYFLRFSCITLWLEWKKLNLDMGTSF